MDLIAIRAIVALCAFENYFFEVRKTRGEILLRATYTAADIVTGKPELQYTRKWPLSPEATKSEIVQTCFKLAMTSMEHRCREAFTYRDKRVFGPHFDVDALWQICHHRRFDVRPAPETTP